MVVQTATLDNASADVNLKLNAFDDILRTLASADSPLPVVMDNSSAVTTTDGDTSDTSRGSRKDESITKQIAARRRLYRENEKLDRDGLRRQVIELSEELERLRQTRAANKARLEASCPPAFFLWKSCALRQREERQLAEAEQRQLMAAINTQATYIETLSSFAHKRRRVDCEDSSVGQTMVSPKVTDAAYFASCIRDVQANYARAEELLEACNIDGLETGAKVLSEQRRESDGELEYSQRVTKEVQPYPLYDTSCSVSDVVHRYHATKDNFKRYEDVEDPENTYAATFTDTYTLSTGEVVDIQQRLVVRRSFEDERIVITWKFISEGQESFSGLHQDETGWCWLYPLTETTEPGTVLATCIRRAPMYYWSANEARRRQFGQMLREYDREAWTTLLSSLDQLMLDNALVGVIF